MEIQELSESEIEHLINRRNFFRMIKTKELWIGVLAGLIILILFVASYYPNNNEDDKYCGLTRIDKNGTIELHPSFYEMEKEVEDYIGGDYITAQTSGKLIGGSRTFDNKEYLDYVCWFDFTIKKDNVIETVTMQHVYITSEVLEGDNLILWRKDVTAK